MEQQTTPEATSESLLPFDAGKFKEDLKTRAGQMTADEKHANTLGAQVIKWIKQQLLLHPQNISEIMAALNEYFDEIDRIYPYRNLKINFADVRMPIAQVIALQNLVAELTRECLSKNPTYVFLPTKVRRYE